MLVSINPFSEEIIQEYKPLSETEVADKIELCTKAQQLWKKKSIAERADFLYKTADILISEKRKLAELASLEMGKLFTEAIAEIEKCALVCRYYAAQTHQILQDEIIETEAQKSFVAFEPIGIVLAVMPWNFPFWQVFRFAAPALMAGNGALLKHASNVSACSLAIQEIFEKAGLPKNIFTSLLITSSQVENVIKNPLVKAITLTGSEKAGAYVASIAGKNLKKTVLELGGSDPFLVLNDADINLAVKMAVKARLINCGQSCIAAKRFIVSNKVLNEFLDKTATIFKSLKMGNPMDLATKIAPLAKLDLVNDLEVQVLQSIQKGAELIAGCNIPFESGYFYEPTILANCLPGIPVFDEETFGPVMAVSSFNEIEEAIYLANHSQYGLGAAIFSKNQDAALSIAKQLETGCVFINEMTKSDPRLPFGGVKNSGYGRELAHYGMKEFVNIKTIYVA